MASFSPQRLEWSKRVAQKFAVPIYNQIWPNSEMEDISELAKSDPSWMRRDFSGLDIILNLPNGNEIHVAQRFRSSSSGRDFSLRYKVPDSQGGLQESEYFKFLNAFKQGYWYPQYYAFGVTKFGLEDDPLVQPAPGFVEFTIFRMSELLRLLDKGEIKIVGPFSNRDGSYGVYLSVDALPIRVVLFRQVFQLSTEQREDDGEITPLDEKEVETKPVPIEPIPDIEVIETTNTMAKTNEEEIPDIEVLDVEIVPLDKNGKKLKAGDLRDS